MPHAPNLLARWLGLVAALALVTALCPRERARAQPLGDMVVVPVVIGDGEKVLTASSMLEARLLDARVSLISLHDARDRFAARSRPAQVASDSDVDVLAREAREAIEHVAFGRTAAAQKSVREVIARAERTLESLNRETTIARQILDTCLTLVRSTLQSSKRELALEQAMRCRRLVPDLAPSEVAHPANVVGVLAEADNLLRRMRTGRLHVRSTPASQCSVYLNGRHLGTTPFQLDRAAVGEYRVQVECGRTVGRVHVVQLGDEPVSIVVDSEFDRAVASEPRLMLRYEGAQHARERAVSHASQLGRDIGVDDVLLLALEGERAELLRVHVHQARLIARASVGFHERRGFAEPALERALTTVAEARIDGETSFDASEGAASEATSGSASPGAPPSPTARPSMTPSPETTIGAPAPEQAPDTGARSAARSRADGQSPDRELTKRRAGYAALGVAAPFFGLGVYLDLKTQTTRDELSELTSDPAVLVSDPALARRYETVQSRWERYSKWRWTSVAGAGLGTLASVLLVRPRAAVPWWSYAIGGVGVGLVAAGVQQIVVSDRCKLDERRDDGTVGCRRLNDSAHRGALFITAATSFLAVPITHLARRREVAVEAAASASAFVLTLRFGL